jgi:hypothetical protein
MIEIIKMSGIVTDEQIADRMEEKKQKLKKWSKLFDDKYE